MIASASARPTFFSMAAPPPSESWIWASPIFTPRNPRPRARRPPPSPSRWQRYTQALLAANEFMFVD